MENARETIKQEILEIIKSHIRHSYHEEPGGRVGWDVEFIPWQELQFPTLHDHCPDASRSFALGRQMRNAGGNQIPQEAPKLRNRPRMA